MALQEQIQVTISVNIHTVKLKNCKNSFIQEEQ
jgi:hypothetical protein